MGWMGPTTNLLPPFGFTLWTSYGVSIVV